MIYFQIFLIIYIFIYLYIYGYLTGIPKSLKNIKDGKAECIDLEIASSRITSLYNIFIQTTPSDIIKEKMRLDCSENVQNIVYY